MDSSSILDLPDEILIIIVKLLNLRERVRLADTCTKFKELVFNDVELLKDLDCADDFCVSEISHVEKYFENETTSRRIERLSFEGLHGIDSPIECPWNIRRAVNLVDLRMGRITFEDTLRMACILKPLVNLRRFSTRWPRKEVTGGIEALGEFFSRLIYLSVDVEPVDCQNFVKYLKPCKALKHLKMVVNIDGEYCSHNLERNCFQPIQSSLDIFECLCRNNTEIERDFISSISHPKEWTRVTRSHVITYDGCEYYWDDLYLERNMEIHELLQRTRTWEYSHIYDYVYYHDITDLKAFVVPEILLGDVFRIRDKRVAKKFSCLTRPLGEIEAECYGQFRMCTLKLEDIKGLLKDPWYPITYLSLDHSIEENCDMDTVISAFPSLTELVLSAVVKKKKSSERTRNEQPNPDSCFTKIVKNTPALRHVTIGVTAAERASPDRDVGLDDDSEEWDLGSLHSIVEWKNLTSLSLSYIPIQDKMFLVEIGRGCKHLKKLSLCYLYLTYRGFSGMLRHCKNLREFSLQEENLGELSIIFQELFANPYLRTVEVFGVDAKYTDLTKKLEHLLISCPKLDKIVCAIDEMTKERSHQIQSDLKRLKFELGRPTFKFLVTSPKLSGSLYHEDSPAGTRLSLRDGESQ